MPRERARSRARELPAAAVLCALVVVSTVVRLALGRTVPAPTVFSDELVYSELARSFAASGDFAVRGSHVAAWTYGPLYPILASPAYLLSHSAVGAFSLVKTLNGVLFSLAAVPAYFLARRVVTRRAAFVAATLALLVPSAVYSTKVMAESVSYPAFLLAMLGIVAALEHPARRNQLLALGSICLSAAARPQMVILLPALLSAVVVVSWIECREGREHRSVLQRLSTFKVVLVATVGCAAVVFGAAAFGVSILGTYGTVFHHLRFRLIPERLVWLIGDLDLYAGIVPFASFLLFTAWALGRGRPQSLQRFAVGAVAVSCWLFGLAAAYTTAFAHVYDRYVFYLVPLFTIALLAWIERGLPRPRARVAAAAIGVAAFLPAFLPFGRLLVGQEWGTSTSSVGLVPWAMVGVFAGHGLVLRLLVLAFSVGLALTVARARRERAWSLVRISATLFVLASFIVGVGNAVLARSARDAAGPQRLDWIDAAVGPGADVAVIWKGDERRVRVSDRRFGLREAVFFNRSAGSVYDLADPLFPGTPSTHVSLHGNLAVRGDGRAVRADYILAPTNLRVRGIRIAGDRASGLTLYRVRGSIRLGT